MSVRTIALLLALCCLAAASPDAGGIDAGALSNPGVAAKAMPRLAGSLLSLGVPDVQTRIALLLVAGRVHDAEQLMDGLNDLDAVRIQSVLPDRDPFGSWSRALQTYKGRLDLSTNGRIALAAAYAPQAPATAELI